MILSHELKLIFLKSRKVAGTSFEMALSKYCGPQDVVGPISAEDERTRRRLGFRGAQRYRKPLSEFLPPSLEDLRDLWKLKSPRAYYNHMSAAEVRARTSEAVWRDYLKVSIVRNPWDRVVSMYFWGLKNIPDMSFGDWVKAHAEALGANERQYLIDGEVVVDRFIRFERFGDDIRALEAEVPKLAGLADTMASIRAKGSVRPTRGAGASEMFARAPEADALVRERCRFEIERFGYDLGAGPADAA